LHLHLTGSFSFFFPVPATPEIYTLSLHDALPICLRSALGLPAEEVWAAHLIAKHNLLETVREKTGLKFDPEVFTIGFARRETGYKRADLILADLDRLLQIAKNSGHYQIIYACHARAN